MNTWLRKATTLVAGAVLAFGAHAAYPDKPIKLVVTWPPGGSADAVGRQLAVALGAGLGQTVYVENLAGASGNIGNGSFVRSPADGYTLLLATSTTNSAAPNLFAKLPFQPINDFAPIALAAVAPSVLVVRASSPYQTIKDIVDAAKAKPGKLSYGHAGLGTTVHLAAEMFKDRAGVFVVDIPYPGSAPAITDTIANNVQFIVDTSGTLLPYHKAGRLRIIAAMAEAREKIAPEIPTAREAGYDLIAGTYNLLAAPLGTPPEVVEPIARAV